MEDKKTITDVVKAVSQKEDTYGVMLAKDWYNDFGKCPVKKGDKVTIEYTQDGSWKNIQNISVDKVDVSPEKVSKNGQKNLEQLSILYEKCLVIANNKLKPYKSDEYDKVPLEEVRVVATTLFIQACR